MPYISSIERVALEKGEAKGKAEGEVKGKAETLLQILDRRFRAKLPADLATVIRGTTDLAGTDKLEQPLGFRRVGDQRVHDPPPRYQPQK